MYVIPGILCSVEGVAVQKIIEVVRLTGIYA
jgi:hypothetical protein